MWASAARRDMLTTLHGRCQAVKSIYWAFRPISKAARQRYQSTDCPGVSLADVIQVFRMKRHSIVWEWPERRGLEHLQLLTSDDGTKAEGLIVVDAASQVIRFRYSLSLDPDGRLRRCGIFVPVGASQDSIWLRRERDGSWTVNGESRSDLEKCSAFDIMDTPFPKTGLIRSLALEEGGAANVWVACIDNRGLRVSPVEQRWERMSADQQGFRRYRCRAQETISDYYVDERSFVQLSPGRWRIRPGSLSADWQP